MNLCRRVQRYAKNTEKDDLRNDWSPSVPGRPHTCAASVSHRPQSTHCFVQGIDAAYPTIRHTSLYTSITSQYVGGGLGDAINA